MSAKQIKEQEAEEAIRRNAEEDAANELRELVARLRRERGMTTAAMQMERT